MSFVIKAVAKDLKDSITDAWNHSKHKTAARWAAQEFKNRIENEECVMCGNPLTWQDKEGEEITCHDCRY